MDKYYRQKSMSKLTSEQQQLKRQKDIEYEQAVREISDRFYDKKHSIGVTLEEEQEYTREKNKLWNDYKEWAISSRLYEKLILEQEIARAETNLNEITTTITELRRKLKKRPGYIK